jgi:hypothetical protein
MIAKITKAYTRTYSDNHSRVATVEWIDDEGTKGSTSQTYSLKGRRSVLGTHMGQLFQRAQREGVTIEHD